MTFDPLPQDCVRDLSRPQAYPDDRSAREGVEVLETHLSHVFLTRDRVVKLRKPVDLGFVDFSSRDQRVVDCQREVALNRRLAPDVYLGVAPLVREAGGIVVRERWDAPPVDGGPGTGESVVVMRRLEPGGDALARVAKGSLTGQHIDAVARRLAAFHAQVGLGRPAPWEREAWWAHCFRPIASTLESLKGSKLEGVAARDLQDLAQRLPARFEALRDAIEARRRDGRAVDGHGDVHLQHVWFEGASLAPLFIDCVEFDANLRRIDPASEVAFLAMDLAYRGRADLAERFLAGYAAARDDFGLYSVVDAYWGYRAAVRAKVAAIASSDGGIRPPQRRAAGESVARHLRLALDAVTRSQSGAVVAVCGSVGVGKTTVARLLATQIPAVRIASDEIRRRDPEKPGGAGIDVGRYTAERREAVYRGLLERAAPVVASGRTAVLDATYARRSQRDALRQWVSSRGLACHLVEVRCPEVVARDRVSRRQKIGCDASEAGPELVEISRDRFEALTEWPEAERSVVETDGDRDDSLQRLVSRLAVGG